MMAESQYAVYRHRALLTASVLGGVLSLGGVTPSQAWTEVEFSGTLVADPCQVDLVSANQTVEMWPVATSTFINHETSGPKDFAIHLKDCDLSLGTQVSVTFLGEKDSVNPDLFAVNGTAQGIALTIFDSSGKRIVPDEQQRAEALSGTEMTLKWQARVQSTVGRDVTEGEYQSTITFRLEYE